MADTISTYRAEGWTDSAATLDYDRIMRHAERHGLLPLRTEAQAIRAAERAYGWGGEGVWSGKVTIGRLENWRWLAGFEAQQ